MLALTLQILDGGLGSYSLMLVLLVSTAELSEGYYTDKTKLKLDREIGGGDLVLNGGAEV